MKKTAMIALMLAALLLLASCAPTDITGVTSIIKGSDSQTDSTASDVQEPVTDLPGRGSTDGAVYENASLALGISFDSEWTLYNDAQIAELNGLTEKALGEDYAETVKNADLVYDLYAMRSDGSSLNLIFENMGILYGTVMNDVSYIDSALPQLETTAAQLGWVIENSEKTTVTAAEQEFHALKLTLNIGGGTLYETVICKKIGNYMAVMTIASVDSNVIDSLIDSFYKV